MLRLLFVAMAEDRQRYQHKLDEVTNPGPGLWHLYLRVDYVAWVHPGPDFVTRCEAALHEMALQAVDDEERPRLAVVLLVSPIAFDSPSFLESVKSAMRLAPASSQLVPCLVGEFDPVVPWMNLPRDKRERLGSQAFFDLPFFLRSERFVEPSAARDLSPVWRNLKYVFQTESGDRLCFRFPSAKLTDALRPQGTLTLRFLFWHLLGNGRSLDYLIDFLHNIADVIRFHLTSIGKVLGRTSRMLIELALGGAPGLLRCLLGLIIAVSLPFGALAQWPFASMITSGPLTPWSNVLLRIGLTLCSVALALRLFRNGVELMASHLIVGSIRHSVLPQDILVPRFFVSRRRAGASRWREWVYGQSGGGR
jgi:hypothetical protein